MQTFTKTSIALFLFVSAIAVAPGSLELQNPMMAKIQAFLAIALMFFALFAAFTSFFQEKKKEVKKDEAKGKEAKGISGVRFVDAQTLKKILMDDKDSGKYMILEK